LRHREWAPEQQNGGEGREREKGGKKQGKRDKEGARKRQCSFVS
jgi:hypothetical protein